LTPHSDVTPTNRHNARRMRKAMTDGELKLWNEIRAHRLMGLSFRRQLPIAGYIVDFACAEHRIIVEVDGAQHNEDEAVRYDAKRTAALKELGWTVLRFGNVDVFQDINGVCETIIRTIGVGAFR
jgi:very-short-patch-repair endonuclease